MKDHDNLNQKILAIFDPDLERREEFFSRIQDLVNEEKNEDEVYQRIFDILCHIKFSHEESRQHWQRITLLKEKLEQQLLRPVAFRVAMLQYFLSDLGLYQSPYLVELFLYESSHYNIMTDELTAIYNHRFLREYLWKETKRSIRYQKEYSILIMDIDDFKSINDNFGPLAGDELLRSHARIMEDNIRIEDVVARYSGDEFIIILPETSKEGALNFAKRLKLVLDQSAVKVDDKSLTCKYSLGVSSFPGDSNDPIDILEMAEKALYRAKFQGKDRIEAYDAKKFEI